MSRRSSPRALLDHAATTPVRPAAARALTDALSAVGNPASLHAEGRAARRLLEEAREAVAQALSSRPSEVVFTSGATEALNLAVKGLAWHRPERRRIVVSGVEHHAVLDAAAWLHDSPGLAVTTVAPDRHGRIQPDAVAAVLGDDVALVAVMQANNETGTLNDVEAVADVCAGVPLVVDAVQAVGATRVSFAHPAITALAVSGHKVGAPPGSGVLLLRGDAVPLLHGGGQERDVRSGTVSVALACGLAAALTEAVASDGGAVAAMRRRLVEGVCELVPDAVVHGDPEESGRLPGLASIAFPGAEGDALLMLLDAAGVACSLGSACTAGVPEPSHVLMAMGCSPDVARSSLRFSLGWTSTPADVDLLLEVLPTALQRARAAAERTAARRRA